MRSDFLVFDDSIHISAIDEQQCLKEAREKFFERMKLLELEYKNREKLKNDNKAINTI